MAFNSSIEWTEFTWNPITGCTKVSPGCLPQADYVERISKRLKAMVSSNYDNGFKLTLPEHVLEHPLARKKPQTIFVNSMSNLFHLSAARQDKNVSLEFIQKMFEVMNKGYTLIFQALKNINCVNEGKRAKVPFFFSHRDGNPKQWGGVNLPAYFWYENWQAGKKKNGRVLKGRTWEEMPNLKIAV